MIGIYRVWNIKTGNSYIGSSENVEQRLLQQETNIKNNSFSGSDLFNKDLNLHGIESFSFEIVKTLNSQKELESWENYYIGRYDSIDNGYNSILSRRIPKVIVNHIKYEVDNKKLLNKFELAVELKLSESAFKEIIEDEDTPTIKLGKEKRYIIEDVINYYNAKEIEVV